MKRYARIMWNWLMRRTPEDRLAQIIEDRLAQMSARDADAAIQRGLEILARQPVVGATTTTTTGTSSSNAMFRFDFQPPSRDAR
jgi:hypothetical protein